MLNKKLEKEIEKKWEELPANRRDGFYAKDGFEHSKAYKERLAFIKAVINRERGIKEPPEEVVEEKPDDNLGELEKGYPLFSERILTQKYSMKDK